MNRTRLFADMTFIHEGNHTLVENLINFEKMVSPRGVGIGTRVGWGMSLWPWKGAGVGDVLELLLII